MHGTWRNTDYITEDFTIQEGDKRHQKSTREQLTASQKFHVGCLKLKNMDDAINANTEDGDTNAYKEWMEFLHFLKVHWVSFLGEESLPAKLSNNFINGSPE